MDRIAQIRSSVEEIREGLIEFTRQLVRIPSITCQEGDAARLTAKKMRELDYDEVQIDGYGNVLGRVGSGPKVLLMDAHLDVVRADAAAGWTHPPFSGDLEDGFIHGRGSSDTKSSLAGLVYAGALMKRLGLLDGKTVYVSASIMEEDYDDALMDALLQEQNLRPDYVLIAEPSNLKIALGHRGLAVFTITAPGVSSHASMPEKGVNAVYVMNEIIRRVQELSHKLQNSPGEHGTVALTRIESHSASLNAVPDGCTIYLDRRLSLEDTEEAVSRELDGLVAGTNAFWAVYISEGTSWKGKAVTLRHFSPAWETRPEAPLTRAASEAYQELFSEKAPLCKWEFATTGMATAGKWNIPTIGLGPGDIQLAHKANECCSVSSLAAACEFYINLITKL